MENEEKEEKNLDEIILEQIDDRIKHITDEKVQQTNVDYLFKLVDIKKDICNMKYWKIKEEKYMYRDGGYGYSGYDEQYGRRGVPGTGRGRYRGEEAIDEMSYHYGNYHDGGNSYGGKEDSAYKMAEAYKKMCYAVMEELEPKDKMVFKNAMREIMQNV